MRTIAGIVGGLIVAMLTIAVVEAIGHYFIPPPVVDMNDPVQVREMLRTLPVGAFLFVLAAWFTGTFAAAFTAALIQRSDILWPTLLLAGCLEACGLAMIAMIPSPLWFSLVGLALFFPAALWGRNIARGLSRHHVTAI